MVETIGICIAGEGGMGEVHARILSAIDGVRLTATAVGDPDQGRSFAAKWGIPVVSTDFAACVERPDVDAVVIASPSGLHARHALAALAAGKPVLIEIPVALSLADSQAVAAAAAAAGVPAMVCHSRRFAPPHRHLRQRMRERAFRLHHLVVETYFFRRTNLNMFGQPRSWTDNLLWHHACHSVDLAAWLLDGESFDVQALRGPDHPELGIPMDLSIGMRSRRSGTLVTMALSFNNKGPFGGFYRYIGEEETYRAFRDELTASDGTILPLAGSAFEDQDHDFIAALRGRDRRQATGCDVASVLPAMELLDRIQSILDR